ncbi:MAG: phenylalanine--tRNA ligase subunit beta [Pseudomonadota bacterium]
MKFTLSWLKDHLATDASLEALEATLTSIGLEVDGLENPADKLAVFTIARVVEARQHPNADRLRVCDVEIKPGQPTVEVVCGAPNAATGMIGVFAPLGSYIPGTDLTLEERPVRGVVSNGMLVSERELELSDEHDGIIELDGALADRVGERFIDVMGMNDPVFEIGLTPNRPDCTGVRGIARDLAAAGLGKLKPLATPKGVEGDHDCPIDIALRFTPETADACPIFAGRHVGGVTNGASPAWMQNRLRAIGLRPISALVDITNYISMDLGRPLHVYDADKLEGTVHARLAEDGETFDGLDNREHTADATMTVIADGSGVLGFGGILGGATTGCTPETTNVLIECAYFDPVRTATTGRKAGVTSDARYRFERGVDPALVVPGLDIATAMVLNLTGGTPSRARIAGEPPIKNHSMLFAPSLVARRTALHLKDAQIKSTLKALGFGVSGKGDALTVDVPSWRPDIDGQADLVEEVVRIAGLDNVPSTPLPRMADVTAAVLTPLQKRTRMARRLLASRGLVEAITWSFIHADHATRFGGGGAALQLKNPMTVDMAVMRPGQLPGLLQALSRNRNRGFADGALFEIGQAYTGDQPDEQMMLASGVRMGSARGEGGGRHWRGTGQAVDAMDAKADAMAVLTTLGLDANKLPIATPAPAWFHPGRSGVVQLGPKVQLAHFGELHPQVVRDFDLEGPVVAFEIMLHAIPAPKRKPYPRSAYEASDLMPVRRDFAFVVDQDVTAASVIRAASGADKAQIVDVVVFDQFEGGNLGEGKKSLAIEVVLQPKAKTLTDEEIEAVAAKVVANVEKTTGGSLRG